MTSTKLTEYDMIPVFDEKNSLCQKIKIKNKESENIIGIIKIIKNGNYYETYVSRDDLASDIFMGNIQDNKEIGTKLAFIARKLINS